MFADLTVIQNNAPTFERIQNNADLTGDLIGVSDRGTPPIPDDTPKRREHELNAPTFAESTTKSPVHIGGLAFAVNRTTRPKGHRRSKASS